MPEGDGSHVATTPARPRRGGRLLRRTTAGLVVLVLIAAARAHVERLVLEAFVDKARSLPAGDLKVTLNLLCDLHGLSTIEADRAWFMEHGRLTVPRSKAISREIAGLCRKIRPLAEDVVDAFDVPVEMLRAPDLIGG